jgi:hypothetical protein
MHGHEGFAVIWREAQRRRAELFGLWCSRIRRSSGALSLHSDPPPPDIPTGQRIHASRVPTLVTYLAEASMHDPFEHTVTPGRHE